MATKLGFNESRPFLGLASLQENIGTADFEFTPEELKTFSETVSTIKIVGDRYMGVQAQQTNK